MGLRTSSSNHMQPEETPSYAPSNSDGPQSLKQGRTVMKALRKKYEQMYNSVLVNEKCLRGLVFFFHLNNKMPDHLHKDLICTNNSVNYYM